MTPVTEATLLAQVQQGLEDVLERKTDHFSFWICNWNAKSLGGIEREIKEFLDFYEFQEGGKGKDFLKIFRELNPAAGSIHKEEDRCGVWCTVDGVHVLTTFWFCESFSSRGKDQMGDFEVKVISPELITLGAQSVRALVDLRNVLLLLSDYELNEGGFSQRIPIREENGDFQACLINAVMFSLFKEIGFRCCGTVAGKYLYDGKETFSNSHVWEKGEGFPIGFTGYLPGGDFGVRIVGFREYDDKELEGVDLQRAMDVVRRDSRR